MELIVAVDAGWGIGKDNQLLARIPPDLKRFKALTTGHPVILGRKTLSTFPGGRPLPGRDNLILSATPGYTVPGAVVYPSLEALLPHAAADAFVIGGQSVYQALLPHCTKAHITQIGHTFPADSFFPNLDTHPRWTLTEQGDWEDFEGLPFRYCTYEQAR